jgi:hypothetical protein
MAYGNAERMWNLQEYIKEYDTLKQSHSRLMKAVKTLVQLSAPQTTQQEGIWPMLEQAIAEAEK